MKIEKGGYEKNLEVEGQEEEEDEVENEEVKVGCDVQ